MKLIILHYHLRPGGIRRIIELATPHLVKTKHAIKNVILATGESADPKWKNSFEKMVAPTRLNFFIEPSFNYLSEQNLTATELTRQIRDGLRKLFAESDGSNTLVWAHNLGIARNLILSRELVRECESKNVQIISHHHDFWFDNRWLRWPEMQRFGFRSLDSAARAIFPPAKNVRHFTINQSDASQLQKHFGKRVGWLPNLSERTPPPDAERLREARSWLQHRINDKNAPVWILPCRLLRRKNVAEALLLARWLRPGAWLVTTGAASSADEQFYFDKLSAAAHQHHWRLRLGVLAGDEARKPSVAELLAASEAVMLTSIQEGFGLPYLEAAASRRPLIARTIPNIAPDLRKFGFQFPQCYEEVLVAPELFHWKNEVQRQAKLFEVWRAQLPRVCRRLAGEPILLAAKENPRPIPFSRLTLSAQLEVLSIPARESWEKCAPSNSFLVEWKKRAASGKLKITPWPRSADAWMSGPAYARRFRELAKIRLHRKPSALVAVTAQQDFIRAKLDAEHLFPLLWSRET